MSEGPAAHTPVLLREVCELTTPSPGETVLDATVGLGGHARAIADRLGPTGLLVGLDVDASNLATAERTLEGVEPRVVLTRANFRDLDVVLAEAGIDGVDVLLVDLGISSAQLGDPGRGFSFQSDGPLDMRMDDRLGDKASDLINRLGERDLADLIYYNANERASRRIAKAICRARRDQRITTTSRLVAIVAQALGVDPKSRRSKIHPATRTFQALRIAVNDELGALAELLEKAPRYLNPGGRLAAISFHSLEDRLVKRSFRQGRTDGLYEIRTKKPVLAGEDERRSNPRSRSAKLRVAVRTEQCMVT
ncbi:MAG: 16S rRNA (cytosine(1402)-N(4))-methyltransferase RsmH [Planctomycetes bacterium]|nr:16S rRNA (cytosine(1402)-N(4))-methyltransferase RsmH [Planctomycetota bacterium]